MYSLTDFHYDLPNELIARYPLNPRTASRLLCLDKKNGQVQHRHFSDLASLLSPGDLLVFNNTRVIPARLFGHKDSGGKVEIMLERPLDEHRALAHVRASKAPKPGAKIKLDKDVMVEIVQRHDSLFEICFLDPRPLLEILQEIGHIPLPPYMNRADELLDQERYQTVYAQQPGAVAAPTAGLHFDEALLAQLDKLGIAKAFVTLHVGSGTFLPVRVQNIAEHVMHSEYAEVSAEVCQKIQTTKAQGKKVIAVGTTSVRCLETAARAGTLQPFIGDTNIFIYPGYQFQVIDAMITNFHLPESTLLMLICAFAGYDNTLAAYKTAVAEQYRFFSYGDAMWVA